MKKGGLIILAAVLCVLAIPLLLVKAEEPKKHKYIGTSKCGMCHNSKDKGEQLNKWKASDHSKAYEVLASDKAKEIAKGKGIADAQKSDECLACHVTEGGVAADLLADGYEKAKGVGCESCHGAGADYKAMGVMKDKKQALANGLIEPKEEVCIKCHNSKSPTFKEFKFDEMVKKIAHSKPASK